MCTIPVVSAVSLLAARNVVVDDKTVNSFSDTLLSMPFLFICRKRIIYKYNNATNDYVDHKKMFLMLVYVGYVMDL